MTTRRERSTLSLATEGTQEVEAAEAIAKQAVGGGAGRGTEGEGQSA